ncbi:TolC family protein [Marinoscillum pacificum]|uniref:TolC family protein n=1 Tax=Marinoscillum pacificum TaxID=392723 RepID=UPI0021579D61|nr:TolC family protein [Marinoscillum pacificum]
MKYYTLLITLLIGAGSAWAQQPLSLSDAIQIGLERNYDIQIEQKNVITSQNNNSWGEAGILPSVRLDVASQNNIRNQQSDNQFFGGQLFPGFELDDQRTYGLTPSLNINWTIFQGNKAIISKRRLEQLEAESMQNADVVIANTLQAIILAYYNAVLEKDRFEAYQTQLELSRDRFRYTDTKYQMGSAVTSDVLLEENNYLTDSTNLINQGLIYRNAVRTLNVLLVSEDINQDYEFTDELIFEVELYDFDELKKTMYSENVDMKKIYISQSILETQVRQNKADLYPTLSFNGGYNWNRNVSDLTNASYTGPNPEYQNPPEPLVSKTGTYFANFTLSFNLFNGGKVNRAIRNAVVAEDIGNLRIEKLETTLDRDLYQAYERYQVRRQLYGISNRSEEAARINYSISEEKFKGGTINSFDFRVVQNNYLTASVQKLQALYNLMDSKVELMRLSGGLIGNYGD